MSELDTSQLEVAAQALEGNASAAQAPVSENTTATTDVPVETSEAENTPSESTDKIPTPTTKAEVLAQLRQYVEQPETSDRAVLDRLRNVFYRLHNDEILKAREAFVAEGGNAEDFVPAADPDEQEYKRLVASVKEVRAKVAAEAEATRQANLQRKLDIIEEIKQMVAQPEDIDKKYDRFKALQAEWKEIGNIPAEHVTETWKNFHHNVEQFYDLLRINHEMRAYDFKKNLEIKTRLCESAEKLAEDEDVVAAFHALQKLHQEFRETGPVAKEQREEIWNRFKAASTTINKRHQDFFLGRKQEEEENLAKKTNLCEQVEALNFESLSTMAEWDAMSQLVIGMQNEWKTVGFTPRKQNQAIFERFRTACDRFFTAKAHYFRNLRETLADNLAQKTALCQRAEELKDSTDWSNTTNAFVALQAEWKKIGPVAHKVSDAVWKRFNTACNAFFDRKKEANSGVHEEEQANLTKKLDVIARLQQLADEGSEQLQQAVKALQAEWAAIGHVPFRKKEKIYRTYRTLCDKIYETVHREAGRRRVDNITRRAAQNGGSELQRLQRAYETKKAEIQTYETNLTFLNSKSKAGNSLVADIERRIQTLRNDLEIIAEKIKEVQG
ncbi:MAG: DUF349 domain-containing protein [Prevotellaceae bacterium]|nr:DUF349 domain-containing protein [Prevotellaceae bacterium]